MAHTRLHVVNPDGPIDLSKVVLPPGIGTWNESPEPSNIVTLDTAGTRIEDGAEAIRQVYPNIETYGSKHEANRIAIDYSLGRVVLQPIHLGTGAQGQQRKEALEQLAAKAGYFWGGKPSIGRWLVAMADGQL